MRAGPLRNRAEIFGHDPDEVPDSFGQLSGETVSLGKVWCEIMPLKGNEPVFAMQTVGKVTHRIRMRWSSRIPDTSFELRWRGRTFRITQRLNVLERNRELDCVATEVA